MLLRLFKKGKIIKKETTHEHWNENEVGFQAVSTRPEAVMGSLKMGHLHPLVGKDHTVFCLWQQSLSFESCRGKSWGLWPCGLGPASSSQPHSIFFRTCPGGHLVHRRL